MAHQEPSGIHLADLIQIWIGIGITASAIFGWLTWRLANCSWLIAIPHLTIEPNPDFPELLDIALDGPGADQWQVAMVRVLSPRDVTLMSPLFGKSSAYQRILVGGNVVGRKWAAPPQTIMLSSFDVPVRLAFKLSLKASPRVTSRRAILISMKL